MIHVRALGPDDALVLREIRLRALADTPESFGSLLAVEAAKSEEDWRAWLGKCVWFAGFDGDAAVAIVCGLPAEPEWSLFSMWVAPEARGNGLAGVLVGELRAAAKPTGARSIGLHVFEDNGRARRIYERLGFVATGAWESDEGKGRRERMRLVLHPDAE